MTDSHEEILLVGQRIGDPIPSPNERLIQLAESLGFKLPYDRPWLPAPRPLGMRSMRMGCMCIGGRFGYERYAYKQSCSKDRRLWIWLGQCPACQVIYWCLEV